MYVGRGCPCKNAAIGDWHRPVLSAGMIAADIRHHLLPSGTRGLLNIVVACGLCPQGRSWAVAGPVPNHGRQRPLATHIHRDDNPCHDSMVCFAVGEKGDLGRSGTSLLMFWPLLLCQPRAKYSRCEFEF